MPRYKFKAKDLAPLRPLLENPDNRRLLESALPRKKTHARAAREEVVELPVEIQSRDKPEGVPLHSILEAAREQMPSVVGISVRGNSVVLKHAAAPPTSKPAADAARDGAGGKAEVRGRKQLHALLGDRQRLIALRDKVPAESPASLTDVLLDDATPDDEWLRAFRRYAVANLIRR